MTEQADLLKDVQAGLAKTDEQRNIASTASELDVLYRLMVEEVTTEEVNGTNLIAIFGILAIVMLVVGLAFWQPWNAANSA